MRRALLRLKHPRREALDFVEPGMTRDVRVEDGRVVVILSLPPASKSQSFPHTAAPYQAKLDDAAIAGRMMDDASLDVRAGASRCVAVRGGQPR